MSDLDILSEEATPGHWGQYSASVGPWKKEALETCRAKGFDKLDTSHHMSAMTEHGPKRLSEWKHANDAAFAEALVNAFREGRVVEVGTGPDQNQDKWDTFAGIVARIEYKPGWYFRTGVERGGPDGSRMWVQVGVTEEAEICWDMVEGKKVPWRGAKHYLSAHMCRNEIVSTVYHAIKRAEYHEVDEWFRYAPEGKKARSIHNPHLDPDALALTASKFANFDTRENAMTMEDPS